MAGWLVPKSQSVIQCNDFIGGYTQDIHTGPCGNDKTARHMPRCQYAIENVMSGMLS